MNLVREVAVTYQTVPLVVKGVYEPASDGLPATLLVLHVLAGGVDIESLLIDYDIRKLEGLALRELEGRPA